MSWISELSWQGDRYRLNYSWCGVGVGVGVQSGWDCITEADSDGLPGFARSSLLNAPSATGNTQRTHNATAATDRDLFELCDVDSVFIGDDGLTGSLVNRRIEDNIFLAQIRNTEILAPTPENPHVDSLYSNPIDLAWPENI